MIEKGRAIMNFDEWGEYFATHGAQPGEQMRDASLHDLEGEPLLLSSLWSERPLVLVTASLTCPIARSRLPALTAALEPCGDRVTRAVLYCREAHPKGDPAPHSESGEEWLTDANVEEGILHRQPREFAERAELARQFQQGWAPGFTHIVDGLDDEMYRYLGTASCAGLLIDSGGVVRVKQGWLEPNDLAGQACHPGTATEP